MMPGSKCRRVEQRRILPCIAVDNLVSVSFEACDLAADGQVADGYQVLLLGKQKALEGDANFELRLRKLEGRWDAAGAICAYAHPARSPRSLAASGKWRRSKRGCAPRVW